MRFFLSPSTHHALRDDAGGSQVLEEVQLDDPDADAPSLGSEDGLSTAAAEGELGMKPLRWSERHQGGGGGDPPPLLRSSPVVRTSSGWGWVSESVTHQPPFPHFPCAVWCWGSSSMGLEPGACLWLGLAVVSARVRVQVGVEVNVRVRIRVGVGSYLELGSLLASCIALHILSFGGGGMGWCSHGRPGGLRMLRVLPIGGGGLMEARVLRGRGDHVLSGIGLGLWLGLGFGLGLGLESGEGHDSWVSFMRKEVF